ncbi:MAG: hypothetical protein HY054_05875, partial [Proteobacteria bacterium]|nr:hypothetical protein [Pseudomonadota bacterium]
MTDGPTEAAVKPNPTRTALADRVLDDAFTPPLLRRFVRSRDVFVSQYNNNLN